MTHTANAKVAGVAFLVYIAAGIALMLLYGRATEGEAVAAQLAAIVQHGFEMRITVLLNVITSLSALVLAVSLFAITRETDADVAMLGLTCRVAEGVVGFGAASTRGLLWLASGAQAGMPGDAAPQLLGAYLLKSGAWSGSAMFFAVGSLAFCWLMLRGRIVPVALAWLGVLASLLLVVCLPLQLAGFLSGPIAAYMWLPMLAFEVPLALWLIVKGVPGKRSQGASPSRPCSASSP